MTRRKYIKLRRERPELFKHFKNDGSWESMSQRERQMVLGISREQLIRTLTEFILTGAEPVG